MAEGTKFQCSSIELNGLIQIRWDTTLLESDSKAGGKVVEKYGSVRMARGTQEQCSSIELDGLIKVRWDTPLLESVPKASGKVFERYESMRMSRRTPSQGGTTVLDTAHLYYSEGSQVEESTAKDQGSRRRRVNCVEHFRDRDCPNSFKLLSASGQRQNPVRSWWVHTYEKAQIGASGGDDRLVTSLDYVFEMLSA
jgi:hypothetical protein